MKTDINASGMESKRTSVDLSFRGRDLGICLIIERESGVWWSNQVGGIACIPVEVEGILVPLTGMFWPGDPLENYRESYPALDREISARESLVVEWLAWADLISALAWRSGVPVSEAWLPVTVKQDLAHIPESHLSDLLLPFLGEAGFVTYCNSD